MAKLHPTPAAAARKEVRVYDASGRLLKSKTWRIKRLSSKKIKKAA
jgi:hypothetical protein